jgi:hypothetical protein
MKEHALKVFRQPPDRLNCAQSVLYAWREVIGDTAITVADLKPFGAGRAPDGLCGAVYAACQIAPGRAEELKAAFAARLGSLHCKEIRAAKKYPCADCVAHAAELLAGKESSPKPTDCPGDQPSSEPIAALAYSIWEQEGRPHGRDVEHWFQAEARLCLWCPSDSPPGSLPPLAPA